MPLFGAIKRRDLIRALKEFGFAGPFPGGKHEYLEKGQLKVPIPNPHQSDISVNLLARVLRKANNQPRGVGAAVAIIRHLSASPGAQESRSTIRRDSFLALAQF